MVRVENVLNSWKQVRTDTVTAVKDFSAFDLGYRPLPELQSFRELAHHILVIGYALSGMVLNGVDDLSGPDYRPDLERYAAEFPETVSAEELAAQLTRSMDQRAAQLAAQTPEFFSRMITRFDMQRVTVLELVQFLKEHELTHRAQLFLYLRLNGIVPVTTRRRRAAGKE